MASIWRDRRTDNFLIKFHFGGKRYLRSCQTTQENGATRLKASVEETLALIGTGRLLVPTDVSDPALWIMSGGKVSAKPIVETPPWTLLGEICKAYLETQLDKAATTLVGERVHMGHLKRVLGQTSRLDSISLDKLQEYVNVRLKAPNRSGTLVTGKTIRKELLTFSQIWNWAQQRGVVRRHCPLKDPLRRKWLVSIPMPSDPEQFMPWQEIERRVQRLPKEDPDRKTLWRFLFLDEGQRDDLLIHVQKSAAWPFICPMFFFAALTGARRSEICRSLIEDFKFDLDLVILREKKRRKDRADSQRSVPMHPRLKEVMLAWFRNHPGGRYTIAAPVTMPRGKTKQGMENLVPDEVHKHFKATLAGSKWAVVRGFHVLRHSFGAISARSTIPMSMTGKWMGHSTEEMMAHYQHLYPDDEQAWLKKML